MTAAAVAIGGILAGPTAAFAAEVSESGTISTGGQTYVHNISPCSAGNVATHYSVVEATLVGTSASTLTATVQPSGFTANLGVYQGVFLPDSPIVNCFGTVAGAGAGAPLTYTTPLSELLPGFQEQTFYFVVAGQGPADAGDFSITVNSSNATAVELEVQDAGPGPIDTTPPVVSVPEDIIQEATGPEGEIVNFSVTASDAVDGERPVTCVRCAIEPG